MVLVSIVLLLKFPQGMLVILFFLDLVVHVFALMNKKNLPNDDSNKIKLTKFGSISLHALKFSFFLHLNYWIKGKY